MKLNQLAYTTSLLLIFFLAFPSFILQSQTFEKAYKDPWLPTHFAAVKRSGSHYYACGSATSPADEIYFGDFSKLDLNGNLVWTVRPFGDLDCRFFDFAETVDGEFLIIGRTEPATAFTQGQDNKSIICRIDEDGVVDFARSYEFSPTGREGLFSIRQDENDATSFFITGSVASGTSTVDRVVFAQIDDAGNFGDVSELSVVSSSPIATDNEFSLKIDQINAPSPFMWICGVWRVGGGSIIPINGLITGVSKTSQLPIFSMQLESNTAVQDILPEMPGQDPRILGVGHKDNEAIFFAYDPELANGFFWSVKVSGQANFFKIIPASAPQHYYVLGREPGSGPAKFVVHYFNTSGATPAILWSKKFDVGETSFSDAGISASETDRLLYFDTRQDNSGSTGPEVFLTNYDPILENCLVRDTAYAVTSIMLTRSVPDISRITLAVPEAVEYMPAEVAYEQRDLCNADSSACCKDLQTFLSHVYADLGIYQDDCTLTFCPDSLETCQEICYDWGDGSPVVCGNGNFGYSHTYANSGSYTVVVTFSEYSANGDTCFRETREFDICVICKNCEEKITEDVWTTSPAVSWNILNETWTNNSGNYISATKNGDFFVTGAFLDVFEDGFNPAITANNGDVFVAKYNNCGKPYPDFTFGFGGDGADIGAIIQPDRSIDSIDNPNGFVVAGIFYSESVVVPSFGNNINSVTLTKQGTSTITANAFLARYDEHRNLKWAFNFGANGANQLNDMEVTNDGSILIMGYVPNGSVNFNPQGPDATIQINGTNGFMTYTAKYSKTGQLQWVNLINAYPGLGMSVSDAGDQVFICGEFYDIPNSTTYDGSGNAIVGPATMGIAGRPFNSNLRQPFLSKIDGLSGEHITSLQITNPDISNPSNGVAWDVEFDGTSVYLGGNTTFPATVFKNGFPVITLSNLNNGHFLLKFDNIFNILDQLLLPSMPSGSGIFEMSVAPNDQLYVAGARSNTMFVDIYESDILKKSFQTGPQGGAFHLSVAPDPDANSDDFAISGIFSGYPDFDADPEALDPAEETNSNPLTKRLFIGKFHCDCPGTDTSMCLAAFETSVNHSIVTFTNNSLGQSYQWNFGDSITVSTFENPTHTYTAKGTYTVTLTVSNICGTCTATKIVTIDTVSSTTQMMHDQISMHLSPNPAGSSTRIEWSQPSGGQDIDRILITDPLGRMVREMNVSKGASSIEVFVKDLLPGIYFVNLKSDALTLGTMKLVKN